jgi:hypothetical protein
MSRALNQIRAGRPGQDTLYNLIATLDAKLELAGRLAVFEFEASEEGFDDCAEAFHRIASEDRAAIEALMDLVAARSPELLPRSGLA